MPQYYPNQFSQPYAPFQQPTQPSILPPQQIVTAKGKASIDTLKMSPNSSVLIADETEPVIWKCMSDGLGNVTAEAWDITPHKDPVQKQQEDLSALVLSMNERLKRLEDTYEQSITWGTTAEQYPSEHGGDKKNLGNAKKHVKPTRNAESGSAEQS